MKVRAAAAILCALCAISLSSAEDDVFSRRWFYNPEVLALIVATALLTRHHRTQREREIRTVGGG